MLFRAVNNPCAGSAADIQGREIITPSNKTTSAGVAADAPLTCAGASRWYGIRAFSYLLQAATFSAIPRWFFSLPASCACQGKRHLNSISRVSAPHLKISLPRWPPLRLQCLGGDRQHSYPSTNSLYFLSILGAQPSRGFSFLHSLEAARSPSVLFSSLSY